MAEEKTSKGKYIFLLLRIAVVVCGVVWGIVWISRDVGWGNLAKTFLAIDLSVLVLCLGIFALGQIIVGLRWWLLLRSQGIFISIAAAVKLHFLGLFYNNFMPSSIGGDLVRAWYVTHHTDKRLEAALSVFVDRAIGLTSTLVIALFFYSVFLSGTDMVIRQQHEGDGGLLASVAKYRAILIWAVVIVCAVFVLFLSNKKGRELFRKGFEPVSRRGAEVIRKIINAVIIYSRSPGTILAVFALTICMQLMVITGFYFLGENIGVGVSIKYYYVFFTLTWVLGAIPVSIGGVVVVEGSLIVMFGLVGVKQEAASALALCQRAVWMLTSLPGAFIHLIGAHLPVEGDNAGRCGKEFSIDEDKVKD